MCARAFVCVCVRAPFPQAAPCPSPSPCGLQSHWGRWAHTPAQLMSSHKPWRAWATGPCQPMTSQLWGTCAPSSLSTNEKGVHNRLLQVAVFVVQRQGGTCGQSPCDAPCMQTVVALCRCVSTGGHTGVGYPSVRVCLCVREFTWKQRRHLPWPQRAHPRAATSGSCQSQSCALWQGTHTHTHTHRNEHTQRHAGDKRHTHTHTRSTTEEPSTSKQHTPYKHPCNHVVRGLTTHWGVEDRTCIAQCEPA